MQTPAPSPNRFLLTGAIEKIDVRARRLHIAGQVLDVVVTVSLMGLQVGDQVVAHGTRDPATGRGLVIEVVRISHIPLVLIIEDDRDYREVVQQLLVGIGVRVVVAANGIEGLEQPEASRPDLVFCDLAMPEMDGIEFGIRMRGDMRFGRVPLIAVTGRRDQAALLDSWGAGFDGHLDKPVTTDVLAGVIERFAERLSR